MIAFARSQIGKPYLWGGTGPDAFDCSGLMMMAYRSVGINIPRTSEEQWTWGPRVAPGHEQPGDLVFFAGSDGTTTSPGHVALGDRARHDGRGVRHRLPDPHRLLRDSVKPGW